MRAFKGASRLHPLPFRYSEPSRAAILGSMIAPAFLDRYLARNVYEARERHTTVGPDRRDNLFHPGFSNEARNFAGLFSGAAVRGALLAIAVVCIGGLAVLAGT